MRNSFTMILFFLLSGLSLFASEYSWSVHASKNEAYVNEAIYLKYVCTFSDKADLYSVEFNPMVVNDTYSVKLLSKDTKLIDGRKVNSYEFVVFVKKAMDIDLSFDTLMEKTTKASIENTVLGRDNADYEEFSKTAVKQESVKIHVKEISTGTYGNFSLALKKDESEKKAYEPYHLDVTLSGTGDFDSLQALNFAIKGVEVFHQKPVVKTVLTKDGYKGSWNQKFAFVGKENFIIPEVIIKYFNGKNVEVISIDSININVEEGYKKEALLDELEQSKSTDYTFIYYIFTFITGFLVSKIKFKTKKRDSSKELFIQKVKDTKSPNELSILLILHNQKLFQDIITSLDEGNTLSLAQAKKKAIYLV